MKERLDFETPNDAVFDSGEENTLEDELTPEPETEMNKSNEQKDEGEEMLRSLEQLPDDYHVSAEHKILFGTLDNNDDESNYPITLRDHGTFTVFGLEYGRKRTPFKLEIQQKIHERCVEKYLESENGIDELEEQNEAWEYPMMDIIKKSLRGLSAKEYNKQINAILEERRSLPASKKVGYIRANKAEFEEKWEKDKKDEKREEIIKKELRKLRKELEDIKTDTARKTEIREKLQAKNPFAGNESELKRRMEEAKNYYINREYEKIKEEDIGHYAIENGIMSEDEYQFYYDYKKNSKETFDRFVHSYEGNGVGGHNLTFFERAIKDCIRLYSLDKLEKSPVSSVEFEEAKLRTRSRLLHRYNESLKGIPNGDELLLAIIKRFPKVNDDKFKAQFNDMKDKAEVFYSNLLPKYLIAESRFFDDHKVDKYILDERVKDMQLKREETIKRGIDSLAESEIEKLKMGIVKTCFEEEIASIEDVFVTNTGVTVLMKDGTMKLKAISPLNSALINLFNNEKEKNCWSKVWGGDRNNEDTIAREVLSEMIVGDDLEISDEFDKKVEQFFYQNQIDCPKLYDEETGKVYDSIQKEDMELLEDLIPRFGGFIKGVDLGISGEDITLSNTRLEVVDYMSGKSRLMSNMLLVRGDCQLKLREVINLLENAGDEKKGKVFSRIGAELGISLYEHLSRAQRDKFNEMIGYDINVSDIAFYKVFRRSVPDPMERKNLAKKTLFLREFNRYLMDSSSSSMRDYFDSLKKQLRLV